MDLTASELIQYKPDDWDKYLRDIQRDLSVRVDINKKLEKDVKLSEANKMAVNNFMDRYDDTIEQQYNTLVYLNDKIRKEISLNKELTDKSLEFQKLLQTERCVKIRERLKEIKEKKAQLNHFLEERGIQAPKI